ncbi:MAG TPA: MoxR family ATPase [Candidatus Limnocylindria bacterium]|jgi:MoxR-like ATPase|nr:MoxR family ATPase [Candidatus Limnocylindria bacterium]
MDTSGLATRIGAVAANVERVIFGKHHEVELALVALVCRGHILVEDVPGVGKTVLAKAIARSLGCSFRRIQFTPDLLPSDVTGVSIFNQRTSQFEFRPGPVMTQIVLADEINRATPKTQSALLEAMEEHQVTVDGVTYQLPDPFLVMATQNPIEYEGTFPLPEAQLDRFFIRLQLGYPKEREEIAILDAQRVIHPLETIEQVMGSEELVKAQTAVRDVHIAEPVKTYVVNVVNATRSHPDVYLGASPRGSLALARASQAYALIQGRDFVLPDDVKALAGPTLSHRLILQPQARLKDLASTTVIAEVLASVPVELSHTAARA